jgi:hypothetical protein
VPKLDIVTLPGTEPWALTDQDSERVARWLRHDVQLEYWPRDRVGEAWARDKGADTPERAAKIEAAGLPFRGYSFSTEERGCVAVIFVDKLEDYESASFVVLHELAHLHLPPWSSEPTNEEEDRADLIASSLMNTLLDYAPGVREAKGSRSKNPRTRCCPGF